jgi:hypothetical protein
MMCSTQCYLLGLGCEAEACGDVVSRLRRVRRDRIQEAAGFGWSVACFDAGEERVDGESLGWITRLWPNSVGQIGLE